MNCTNWARNIQALPMRHPRYHRYLDIRARPCRYFGEDQGYTFRRRPETLRRRKDGARKVADRPSPRGCGGHCCNCSRVKSNVTKSVCSGPIEDCTRIVVMQLALVVSALSGWHQELSSPGHAMRVTVHRRPRLVDWNQSLNSPSRPDTSVIICTGESWKSVSRGIKLSNFRRRRYRWRDPQAYQRCGSAK